MPLQWVDEVFSLAVANLRLNGRPYDEFLSSPERESWSP